MNTVDTDNSLLTPNIRDSKGRSPLHVTHDPEIIKTLINYGAQIESKDLEGNTPLHVMSYKGQINAIKLILSNGANLVSLNFQVRFTITNRLNSFFKLSFVSLIKRNICLFIRQQSKGTLK